MMFPIMPWCRIDRAYSLDDISIVPYHRDGRIDGVDETVQRQLAACRAGSL